MVVHAAHLSLMRCVKGRELSSCSSSCSSYVSRPVDDIVFIRCNTQYQATADRGHAQVRRICRVAQVSQASVF